MTLSRTSAKPPPRRRRSTPASARYASSPGSSAVTSAAWSGSTPICPQAPSAVTSRTSASTSSRSGVYTRRWKRSANSGRHLTRLLARVVDRAHHVEGLLGQVVVLALDDLAEAADGLRERHVDALVAGELLGHVEGLGEELLDLARPGDGELVVLGELVHAEDGDDVLQVLVALQDRLDLSGHAVVLLADHRRAQDARGRVERVDGGVDAELGDLTREYGGRVQVREGGRRRRVGQVVGGDVDRLHGGDGALLGGGVALLDLYDGRTEGRLA